MGSKFFRIGYLFAYYNNIHVHLYTEKIKYLNYICIEVLSPYKLLRFMNRDIACKFFHIFIMILDYDLVASDMNVVCVISGLWSSLSKEHVLVFFGWIYYQLNLGLVLFVLLSILIYIYIFAVEIKN